MSEKNVIKTRTRSVVIPKLRPEDEYSDEDDDYEPSEGEEEEAIKDQAEDEKKSKRKTKAAETKRKKKQKVDDEEQEEEEKEEEEEGEDETVDIDGDDKETVDNENKNKKTLEEMLNEIPDDKSKESSTTKTTTETTEKKVEVFEFAGEKFEREVVTKTTTSSTIGKPAAGLTSKPKAGGLDNILSNLGGKPKKLTTLQKSQLDWEKFKDGNALEKNEMEKQAKNGYLEKQAFLQRTDQNLLNNIKSLTKKK